MYKCDNCDGLFEEAEKVRCSAEDYNGVSSMFGNSNDIEYDVCPFCGSEDFNLMREDEDN